MTIVYAQSLKIVEIVDKRSFIMVKAVLLPHANSLRDMSVNAFALCSAIVLVL